MDLLEGQQALLVPTVLPDPLHAAVDLMTVDAPVHVVTEERDVADPAIVGREPHALVGDAIDTLDPDRYAHVGVPLAIVVAANAVPVAIVPHVALERGGRPEIGRMQRIRTKLVEVTVLRDPAQRRVLVEQADGVGDHDRLADVERLCGRRAEVCGPAIRRPHRPRLGILRRSLRHGRFLRDPEGPWLAAAPRDQAQDRQRPHICWTPPRRMGFSAGGRG
jgi:hypothetical protein